MSRDETRISVFLSSTSEDLKSYRRVALQEIMNFGWFSEAMESMDAEPYPTLEACYRRIDNSDVVLLLVAFRQGSVPSIDEGGDGENSITALELAHARKTGKPVLIMMATETSWPTGLCDRGDKRLWIENFRDRINQPAAFFDHELEDSEESRRLPLFRAKVQKVLMDQKLRMVSQFSTGRTEESDTEFINVFREGLFSGSDVPFLGTGVYGTGPLSSRALASELGSQLHPSEQVSLATAAEYCERSGGTRKVFLTRFKDALLRQSEEVESCPIYDLLVRLDNADLIVSASCDTVLENALRSAGRTYTLVTHVLRSDEGKHDGKILIIGEDGRPEFHWADKLKIPDSGLTIYKLLGSPFINDYVDPELEIDTVVATETDHLLFLSRLENQYTQIPPSLLRQFRARPLLFLGYGLEVWQYRLVMQAFRDFSKRAVRRTDSPMESLAWRRLGADIVSMDLDEFASSIQKA